MVLRLGVQIRVVENVVQSARFLAAERRGEDHLGNLQRVQELDEVEVLGFLVLDGGLDVLFQVLDNLEPLIEASDRAHDSAVRPHHVLQHGAALFPEGGLREGDAFLLACLRNGNLVFQKPAFDDVVYGADGKDHTFQQGVGS